MKKLMNSKKRRREEQWRVSALLSKYIHAADLGNISELQKCLDQGIDPNSIIHDTTALHTAVENQNVPLILKLLYHKDVNVNVITPNGETPLMVACRRQVKPIIVKILLKNGANSWRTNAFGKTPLHAGVLNDSILTVMYLLKFTADTNVMDDAGNSPLSLACVEKAFFPMVKLLLNNGADPNLHMPDKTPMMLRTCYSCKSKDSVGIVSFLLENGVSPHIEDPLNRQNALHVATIICNAKLASRLFKYKVNMFKRDCNGRTPSMLAKKIGCRRLITLYHDYLLFLDILKAMKQSKREGNEKRVVDFKCSSSSISLLF